MTAATEAPVVVAGAGVGGLTLAVGLRRAGVPVEVVEQAGAVVREEGTGLNMWGNAVTAFSHVGVAHDVRDAGAVLERGELRSSSGALLMTNPVAELGRAHGTYSVSVRRSALLEVLQKACGDVPVHTGCAVTGYREDADGVTVTYDDGTETRARLLVGADGVHSAVRGQLVGDGGPARHGFPVWRGVGRAPSLTPGTQLMVWGPRGGGAGCWWVDDTHVSWSVGTTSTFPEEPDDPVAALRSFVDGFPDPVLEALGSTPEDSVFPAWVHLRDVAWGSGRVALLGDAAHAMPTVLGQGACQAVEDAVTLAGHLAARPDDPAGARAAYEAARAPRLGWVRDKVFTLDRMQKFEHPLMCRLRDLAVRVGPSKSSRETWHRLLRLPDVPDPRPGGTRP